ncbi:MAG: peptide ABC transporter substrate-binding protein [Bdellovibrio sp.]
MKRTLNVLVLGLLLTSSISARAAVNNDELKIGITQEFENLNPLIMTMSATSYIYSMVGRSLVTLSPDGKWIPQLAKQIPTIENKKAVFTPDKKQIIATWEILDNAKWSDGKPLTCADFDFSLQVAASPTVSVGEKETYTQVSKITWDEKTPKVCTFTYGKARWDFNQLAQFRPLPKHLEAAVFAKHKDQKEGYEKNSLYNKAPTTPGLYNGPYKISEVKLGSHVTLIPNEHFYGSAPKIKKIIVKLIPNTATLEANLRSGTIDMVSSLGFSFDQAVAFEKKIKSESLLFNAEFKPSITYEHIDLNLGNPMLKDVRVRKALVYAINREELVKALFDGKQQVAIHNVSPIDPWFTNDPKKITLYPYSKREAGRLLDEAGWKLNTSDGYRYKDGKKMTMQFMTTAGNKTRETVQTFLQGQWKSVGIEVNIKNEPARVFFADTMKKRDYGAMAMYAWVSSPENSPKSVLHSSNIPSEKNGWSGQNNMAYSNKKVDELIEKIETEFDPKKRTALAQEILKYYTDEVPVIPLYYRSDVAVTPLALKGFRLPGHQFAETNEIENWSVQK